MSRVILHMWHVSEPIMLHLLFVLFIYNSRNVCTGCVKSSNGRLACIKVRVVLFTVSLHRAFSPTPSSILHNRCTW